MESFKIQNFLKLNCLFGIMYTFHKSYFYIFQFIYFYIFEECWKISKIQNFQKLKLLFGIMYTFHNSFFLYIFEKMEHFQNSNFFRNSNLYLVLCIRSAIHNFVFLYTYIFIHLINFYNFIFSCIYIFI